MKHPASPPLPSQRSLTLIEVGMVLAIAAVVIDADAVAYGVLPETYEVTPGEGYDLPISNAKMTLGATDFAPGPNFGVIHVGPLATDACISLGKLDLGEVVKYVIIDQEAGFVGASEADLAAHSLKDPSGDITIAALSGACESQSYVHYYLMN